MAKATKPKPKRKVAWPEPRFALAERAPPLTLEVPVLRNREEILESIDAATEPRVMDKAAALKWLELMVCDLECRMDALKEEMQC